jgi:LiaI-LiaF-like transmembrane region/B-box zinc finger
MKCAVHPDVDATGYCRNCGKAMCGVCIRPVHDVLYCEDCLASGMGHPAPSAVPPPVSPPPPYSGYAPGNLPAPTPQHSGSSPAVAFILGFFPGLGAVYNGEYNKALIHIVVFAAMIVGLSSDMGDGPTTALALLLAGFIFYMAFDAMRVAKAKSLGEKPTDPLEDWSKNKPVGAMILIGLGLLFLLSNFHIFDYFNLWRLWPLVLIAAGVLLFRKRLERN